MLNVHCGPLLLRLILFLVGEYVKDRIFPHLLRLKAAKVVVHERFNCLVNVINDAPQLVVFIRVNLHEKAKNKCSLIVGCLPSHISHLMSEDYTVLNKRFRQEHGVLLMNQSVCCSVYEKIVFRQEVGRLQGEIGFLQ